MFIARKRFGKIPGMSGAAPLIPEQFYSSISSINIWLLTEPYSDLVNQQSITELGLEPG